MGADLTSAARDERGFTLVELLVVMVIIGLLASIAVASFYTQKDKAFDGRAKGAVRTAQTAIETYATDQDGSYADATMPKLAAIEPTLNGAGVGVVSATDDSYALAATSASGNVFTITRNPDGSADLTCSMPARAGCPAGGVWG